MSAFKALGLDPKNYKHIKSDDKSTTLQHKHGHVVTIAHNVLAPKMQAQLKALAPIGKEDQTNTQAQEAQDQKPRKMAEGGIAKMAEGGYPPCLNPNCKSQGQSHPNCRCYGGSFAKGGSVKSLCSLELDHEPNCNYFKGGEVQHYAEGTDNAQSADPNQVMTPMDQSQGDKKQVAPGVNININSGPQPQGNSAQPPPQAPQPEAPQPSLMDRVKQGAKQAITGQNLPQYNNQQAAESQPAQPLAQAPQPQQSAPQEAPAPAQEQPPIFANPQTPQSSGVPQQLPVAQDPFTKVRNASLTSMQQESNDWGNDLKNGHITPKTYESLFENRGTLGKIGTIFGMLLSGAGSGLAHQSNAMLEMMNTQIKNDLDAQEKSKNNAQNFLKLSQAHEMNKASISNLGADTALKAKTLANIRMNQAALDTLVKKTQALPVGSDARKRAEQTLTMLAPEIQNENLNLMGRAAIASAKYNTLLGSSGPNTGNPEDQFNAQQKGRLLSGPEGKELANYASDKHIPGFEGEASRPISPEAQNQVAAQKQYEEKAKEYVEFAKKHSKNWANLDIRQRQAIANQGAAMGANLQSLYRNKIKGGVYKKGEQEFIEQIIPDNPVSWQSSFKQIPKVEQTVRDNTADMNNTVGSLGNFKRRDDSSVSVVSPNGTVGKIPKANLERAIKLGYKQQ